MLGQNLQNVGDQIMDFYLAKTYKKGLPKTDREQATIFNAVYDTLKIPKKSVQKSLS